MSIADMPVVTVEQIVRFREAALKVEQQRDDLQTSMFVILGISASEHDDPLFDLAHIESVALRVIDRVEASK